MRSNFHPENMPSDCINFKGGNSFDTAGNYYEKMFELRVSASKKTMDTLFRDQSVPYPNFSVFECLLC